MTDNQEIEKVEKVEIQKPDNKLNGTALVSMISGILTYIWLPITALLDVSSWLAIVLSPISALVAVITGSRAKKLIRNSQGQVSGKKMANTGLWLGWIYFILCVLVLILVLAGLDAIFSAIAGLIN
jgi:uncharacterized protein involved in cysteine biosynthesis